MKATEGMVILQVQQRTVVYSCTLTQLGMRDAPSACSSCMAKHLQTASAYVYTATGSPTQTDN